MHGSWKLDEDIAIVALRLGTEFGWARIEVEFNKFFPNAPATRKDIESRYNKTLKPELDDQRPAKVADVIDDYRHYRVLPSDQKHAGWVCSALKVLADYPEDRIIRVNPELGEGARESSLAEQLRYALPDTQPDAPYEQMLLQQGQLMQDQVNSNYMGQQEEDQPMEDQADSNYLEQQENGFRTEGFQNCFNASVAFGQYQSGSWQPEESLQEPPKAPAEIQDQGASLYGFHGVSGYSGTEEGYSCL